MPQPHRQVASLALDEAACQSGMNGGRTILGQRIVIIGNSGSGKSTLAERLGARLQLPAIDLDALHWEEAYSHKRDEATARHRAVEAAASSRWIIEGVYGWLASVVLPRATALVWLDLPWIECRAGLLERGPRRGADEIAFNELLSWAEAYSTRTTSSSFEGHRRIYETFLTTKLRLRSRKDVHELLASL